jgi:hypothetical protein
MRRAKIVVLWIGLAGGWSMLDAPARAAELAPGGAEASPLGSARNELRYNWLIATSPWFRAVRSDSECTPIAGSDLRGRCVDTINATPIDPAKVGSQPPVR